MATESERGFKQVPDFEKNEETGEFIKPNDPVNIAEAKILREKVRQCYYKSGVNHYQYVFIIVYIYLYQYVFISTFITNIYLK